MPPSFGLPPAIQKISPKDDSACAAASALVPLESLTNSTLPRRPTCSMRCASPGKLRRPFCKCRSRCPSPARRPRRRPHSAHCAGRAANRCRRALRSRCARRRRPHDGFALDIDAVGQRVLHGDPHHALAGLIEPVGDVAAPAVIDADDGRALRLHAGDQPRLHGGIMLQRAVAVDMVFADIEQNADRRIERGRQIDLVGRHLDHMHAPHPRRLQRKDRGADIAAHLGVVAGHLHQMRDQRRRGRLAVGAGDGDERRVRRMAAALAAEQFDVADHLTAGLPRHQHRPMRRRMRQRRAGGQDQRREIRPRHRAQIGGDEAGLRRLGDIVGSCRRRRSLRRRPPSARGSSQGPSRRGRTRRPSCPQRR